MSPQAAVLPMGNDSAARATAHAAQATNTATGANHFTGAESSWVTADARDVRGLCGRARRPGRPSCPDPSSVLVTMIVSKGRASPGARPQK
jgi:hypothetical protein